MIVLYGQQEGRFYHGYYQDYCYLPLYVFCGEHLLCARLRMSNIDASADAGGGVGAAGGAHSPALARREDSVAGRRGLLPGEADGVVRARGY